MYVVLVVAHAVAFFVILGTASAAEKGKCVLDQCFPKSSDVKDGSKFDFIIVGAGSAGCVLANRLTELKDAKVLLLEAGDDPPLASVIPSLFASILNTSASWNYSSANDYYSSQSLKNSELLIPRGRMLGGCSSMNYMFLFRGNPSDYDNWSDLGCRGWDYNNVVHYFHKCENITNPEIRNDNNLSKYRGLNGPAKNTKFHNFPNLTRLLRESFYEIGVPYSNDLNGEIKMGYGAADMSLFNGKRQSTAVSYISPIIERGNFYILKNTFVRKIILDEETMTAIGVEFETQEGYVNYAYALEEVIVSAGTVNTPQLLMLSGIGPCKHLNLHGIKCIADLPVGKNYIDHPYVPLFVSAEKLLETSYNEDNRLAWFQYLISKTCVHADPGSVTSSAFLSLTNQSYPDYQYLWFYFAPRSSKTANVLKLLHLSKSVIDQVTKINENRSILSNGLVISYPLSRGEILLRSCNPHDKPVIYSSFFKQQKDLDTAVASVYDAIKLFETKSFKTYGAKLEILKLNQCACFEKGTYDFWKCYALNMATTTDHMAGTCKMGHWNDEMAVLDPDLKVKRINNLRVVDASIMPTLPRANINNAVIMIAEKAADLIKHTFNAKRWQKN